MIPQALPLPHPNPFPSILPFLTAFAIVVLVFICIIVFSIVASFIVIIFIYVVCRYLIGPTMLDRHHHDLEAGESNQITTSGLFIPRHLPHQSGAVGSVQNNLWLEVLATTMEAIEERKGLRRQAVENMPPPVSYGSSEMVSKCIDCAICLEDFESGELCQTFPVCNHIFHPNCIQHWLKKNVTCPVCRCSLLNE